MSIGPFGFVVGGRGVEEGGGAGGYYERRRASRVA